MFRIHRLKPIPRTEHDESWYSNCRLTLEVVCAFSLGLHRSATKLLEAGIEIYQISKFVVKENMIMTTNISFNIYNFYLNSSRTKHKQVDLLLRLVSRSIYDFSL